MWRDLVYWWSKRKEWLFPLVMLVIGISIIIYSGGPKPIGSSSETATECGTGLSREIC